MLKLEWLENPDNVVYVDINEFAENFAKETGISKLREEIELFKANPIPEGRVITGTKRTALKLFIPDLMFDKHIEMGENVWIYMGDIYPAYSIYWPC